MLRLKLGSNHGIKSRKKGKKSIEKYFINSRYDKIRTNHNLKNEKRPISTYGAFFQNGKGVKSLHIPKRFPSVGEKVNSRRISQYSSKMDTKGIKSGRNFYITKRSKRLKRKSIFGKSALDPEVLQRRFGSQLKTDKPEKNILNRSRNLKNILATEKKRKKKGGGLEGLKKSKKFRTYNQCLLTSTINRKKERRCLTSRASSRKTQKKKRMGRTNLSSDFKGYVETKSRLPSGRMEGRAFTFYHEKLGIPSGRGRNLKRDMMNLWRKNVKRKNNFK